MESCLVMFLARLVCGVHPPTCKGQESFSAWGIGMSVVATLWIVYY
jgi:hypothetical protein